MIELWRGCANAWECDELGHLNVRFYLAKAWEAVGDLADRVGMPGAFGPGNVATLLPGEIVIRYLGEIRPGTPLVIEGAVIGVKSKTAGICLVVRNAASGKMAAIFRITLRHCVAGRRKSFEWPERIRQKLESLKSALPEEARPRSLSSAPPRKGIRLQHADALSLAEIGRGRINPEDCGPFGQLMPEHLQGKISNSAANFSEAFPEQSAAHASGNIRIGGALLEGRICVRRWPTIGDGYVIRSGVQSADRNVRSIVHWVFDRRGRLLWSMQGVAAIMDLTERKLVKADDETLAALQSVCKPELTV
ncbi:thioesterase family protein [Hyphobacterium indicum]|uniref:thioesterase family protein n=1 Tax=Hyphobacterium indicum TaxID=2162714 RepID=UPI000D6545BD|nr:acyl-ACP thioesterase [Hyphobacterium indicum]